MEVIGGMAQIPQRIAPYTFDVTHGLVMAAGGVIGGFVRKKLKQNKYYAVYIEQHTREWAPLATALVIAVLYALGRDYITRFAGGLERWLDEVVVGVVAGFAARQGGIWAGDTEIFVSGKAKVLGKNVGTIQKVIVDGQDMTANVSISGEEVDLSGAGISEGLHKVVLIGSEKAAYEELYIPA